VNPLRRRWLLTLAALGAGAARPAPREAGDDTVRRGRPLEFPRDHGAHLAARTEWWYATGWAGRGEEPSHGFQVTFFRSRTAMAVDNPSRFAARQLLFAHAALTDLGARRHHHDQRIARWSGAPDAALGAASQDDAAVRLGPWWLRREGERWRSVVAAAGFRLDLTLERSQPLLLQGDAGFSRKGPEERQASHYYSEPQLKAATALAVEGRAPITPPDGRAWIDHEWSDEILHPDALGWDWIGINLADGTALTAFQLRRADGSALWAGGSWRPAGGRARAFAPDELRFEPLRHWSSPATGARYPVHWRVQTPAGVFEVRALLDAQELDGRGSTGTVYWEGLSALEDAAGRRVGLGYLEMTGYAGRLRL
jgi:predicted secreted hydrolase